MSIPLARPSRSRDLIVPLEPNPPAWARDLFSTGSEPVTTTVEADEEVEVVRRDPFVRVTARIGNARALDACNLSSEVAARYAAIAALLARIGRAPLRYWNYVPGIVDTIGPGLDRYMAFNRGRYAAYSQALTRGDGLERTIPVASAIGIDGPDLVVDCLASDRPGIAIENPRQIASWRYSARYGPRPPCFARGSIATVEGRRVLLLAGTASIVGEESQHAGDARAQVNEILANIEALIVNAGRSGPGALHQLTDLRVYVVQPDDGEMVEEQFRARTLPGVRIESAVARVCRAELLVEVEGLAAL